MSYDYLEKFGRPLRWGMVGGGIDSLIGETHRLAARVDGRYQLVAGCLSIDRTIGDKSARICLLPEERSYYDFEAMARAEAARPDGIEVVTICTPPHLHAAASTVFLQTGIDVLCEKPLTRNLPQALKLQSTVQESGRHFGVIWNFREIGGRMWLSFVAAGNEHGLSFRVHGDKGSLKWHQERPEQLLLTRRGEYLRVFTPGHPDKLSLSACTLAN
jgi:predicted dehydrogenase